ncbi:MAG: type I phosphomannose isomerase catalytic subunit [Fulvivirga sp.]
MVKLYPFTFKPIFKEKIWGGDKIKSFLNKDFSPLQSCGESWELSAVDGDESVVANGDLKGKTIHELVEMYKGELMGAGNYQRFGDEFPLLIKFIDANQDLSVQVHPDDVFAKDLYGEDAMGKSEMWYVMQADEGASLISGFKESINKAEFKERLAASKLEVTLNREVVEAGDVFYIPAGRIHTIGKGILIAEIQQTSDVTYRIFDFDREDKDGNKRELHVDKAAEVLNFEVLNSYKQKVKEVLNAPAELVDCKHFVSRKWVVNKKQEIDYTSQDSFKILICVNGQAQCLYDSEEISLSKGDVYLIPACLEGLSILPHPKVEFIEVYIR